jgi:hypothetical protein
MSTLSIVSFGSGGPVLAAGLRAQMDVRLQKTALGIGGLLEPGLAKAFDALEISGQEIAQAGAAKMKADMVGSLLDEMA